MKKNYKTVKSKVNKISLKLVYVFLFLIFIASVGLVGSYLKNSSSAEAFLELYPAPSGITPDSTYLVTVNGQDCFVYGSYFGAYTNFSFNGNPVTIDVTVPTLVNSVDIKPSSKNIIPNYVVGSKSVSFSITNPGQYSIEINDINMPLFIFANSLEANKPSPTDPNVIYYAAGQIYNVGEVVIPSNKWVYIEGGAVVRGKFRIGPGTPSGTAVSNAKLTGRGIVDSTFLADPGRPLRVQKSSGVTVEGITFLGKEAWGVATFQSDNVLYKNIKVINWRETTTGTPDGIDTLGSSNVTIEDSFIRSYDDAITVKNNKFGWSGDVDTVLMQRLVIWNGDAGNATEIGWENNANYIRNITYKDIDIIHKTAKSPTNKRAALGIHLVYGATVSNINYEDIRIEDAAENLMYFTIMKNSTSLTSNIGKLQDIYLKNINVSGPAVGLPIVINGYDHTNTINNVTFENLKYNGTIITNETQANIQQNFVTNIKLINSAISNGDLNNDGKVNVFDLSILLSKWGTADSVADINKDNTVNVFDLSILLSKWSS